MTFEQFEELVESLDPLVAKLWGYAHKPVTIVKQSPSDHFRHRNVQSTGKLMGSLEGGRIQDDGRALHNLCTIILGVGSQARQGACRLAEARARAHMSIQSAVRPSWSGQAAWPWRPASGLCSEPASKRTLPGPVKRGSQASSFFRAYSSRARAVRSSSSAEAFVNKLTTSW